MALSDEDVNRIAEAVVEKAMEDVGVRDIMIGSAMGKGAIPLYGIFISAITRSTSLMLLISVF